MSVLVLDVGTSDVRASLVRSDGRIWCTQWGEVLAVSPDPGLLQFDPPQMAIDHDWIQTQASSQNMADFAQSQIRTIDVVEAIPRGPRWPRRPAAGWDGSCGLGTERRRDDRVGVSATQADRHYRPPGL